MSEPAVITAENLEQDRMTLEVLDDEIKLLDEDMQLLQQDLEALRRKRQQCAEWRQKLLFSTEMRRIPPVRSQPHREHRFAPVKEVSHAIS